MQENIQKETNDHTEENIDTPESKQKEEDNEVNHETDIENDNTSSKMEDNTMPLEQSIGINSEDSLTNTNGSETSEKIEYAPEALNVVGNSNYNIETYFDQTLEGSDLTIREGLNQNDPDVINTVAEDIVNSMSIFADNGYSQEEMDSFTELYSALINGDYPDLENAIENLVESKNDDDLSNTLSGLKEIDIELTTEEFAYDPEQLYTAEGEIKEYIGETLDTYTPDPVEVNENKEAGVEHINENIDPVETIQTPNDIESANPSNIVNDNSDKTEIQDNMKNIEQEDIPKENDIGNSGQLMDNDITYISISNDDVVD